MEIIRQISAVLLVLGLLATALFLLRKRGQNLSWTVRKSNDRRIQVVARATLSANASLALVRVDEREVLIAITGSACTVIEQLQRAKGAAV